MGKAIKLGVIGAGSAVFSLGLVRDLCQVEALHGSRITLMDVDEGRLAMAYRLAERYAQELTIDLHFEATVDRERALADADFVINTALMGGHGWAEGWRRASELQGYYRGLRHATHFHQYGLMLSVARDMERICPDAWLIQSSNPVFEGCTLMTRETGVKVVGLCHGFHGYSRWCDAIGVPTDEVQWEAVGVNHWIYLTQLRHGGRDLYPRIDAWIERESASYWRDFAGGYGDTQLSRAAVDHYRRVGLMPIGDAARTFSEWYYHSDLAAKRRWYGHLGGFDSEIGWGRYLDRLAEKVESIRRAATDASTPVTEALPLEPTRELQIPVMDAIANDNPKVLQVNMPNEGAIAGIADDVVVEGKGLVDGAGVRLLHVGRLPDKLLQMVLVPRIVKAEKELLAYKSGDRDLLVSCILDDHRTRSLDQAEELVDTMLALPANRNLAERFGGARKELGEYDLPALEEL